MLRMTGKTAVGFHERRILLSQDNFKQNISGVPGFEHAHSNSLKVSMMNWKVQGWCSSSLGMRYISWADDSRFD
jgi:hypothetical protein